MRPCSGPQHWVKMVDVGAMQEVETIRRRKRKVGRQKAVSSIQGLPQTKALAYDRCGRNQRHLAEVFRGRPRLAFAQVRRPTFGALPQQVGLDRQVALDHYLCVAAVRTG